MTQHKETEHKAPSPEHHPAEQTAEAKTKLEKIQPSKAVGLLKKKPAVGVVAAGALGLAAANLIGVGEMAIAMAAAYAAYRALTS
jgi:hypothetical protein